MKNTHPSFLLHEVANHIDKLGVQKSELISILEAAIARVEMANSEGDDILSAWLPDAKAAIHNATKESE